VAVVRKKKTAAKKAKAPAGNSPAKSPRAVSRRANSAAGGSKIVKRGKKEAAAAAGSAAKRISKRKEAKERETALRETRKSLLKKREAIIREAKEEIAKYISGENRQLVDTALDEGDLAVVDISEDVNLMRLASHRQSLLDIDETLQKMDEGTYGICEGCGEEIGEKRLSVLPTAALCRRCQEEKEKIEAMEKARTGL
jgi:DnaK suppressor protein